MEKIVISTHACYICDRRFSCASVRDMDCAGDWICDVCSHERHRSRRTGQSGLHISREEQWSTWNMMYSEEDMHDSDFFSE